MFKFENGTLVKNAYVEIDGVQYEVNPAKYSGNTELTAENINKMQEEIVNASYGESIYKSGINYASSDINLNEPLTNFAKIDIIHANWEKKGEEVTTIYEPENKNILLLTKYISSGTSIRTGVNDILLTGNTIRFNKNFFYDVNGYSQETTVSGIWEIIGYRKEVKYD